MTKREAEAFLQEARDVKFKVDAMEQERLEIHDAMITIKSTTDYSERVQSSPRQDGLENQAIRIIERMQELDKELQEAKERMVFKRHRIRNAIMEMKEGQSRRFLMDYYINCESEIQIAVRYHYKTSASIYTLKMRAIKDFSQSKRK